MKLLAAVSALVAPCALLVAWGEISGAFAQFALQARITQSDAISEAIQDQENKSFLCVRKQERCRQGGPFRLRWNQQVSYDSSSPERGLSFLGRPCSGYDEVSGSWHCPFRAHIAWQPVCLNPRCDQFDVQVEAYLSRKTGWRWLDRQEIPAPLQVNLPWRRIFAKPSLAGQNLARQ